MRKYILLFFLFSSLISCSSGQTKDYPEEIKGCWEEVSVEYDLQSNYPHIDSLMLKVLEELRKNIEISQKEENIEVARLRMVDEAKFTEEEINTKIKKMEESKIQSIISKYIDGKRIDFYANQKYAGYIDEYSIERDSLFTQSTIRFDDKHRYKIKISNDTLILSENIPEVFGRYQRTLQRKHKIKIPQDFKLNEMMCYTTFVRVADCDKYQD